MFYALCLTALACQQARGSEPSLVPQSATWVAHVDLRALSRSCFLATLHEHNQRIERDFEFDQIQAAFGVDPLDELSSLTLFGPVAGHREIGAIVRGPASLDSHWHRLLERGRSLEDPVAAGLYEIGSQDWRLIASALPKRDELERTFFVGSSASIVREMLEVERGQRPRRQGWRTPGKSAWPSPGAIFFASGPLSAGDRWFTPCALKMLRELADLKHERGQRFLEHGRALQFEIGEQGQALFVSLEIAAESEAGARAMVVELEGQCWGLKQAVQQAPNRALVEKLLAGVEIRADGRDLRASFHYGAREFVLDVLAAEGER